MKNRAVYMTGLNQFEFREVPYPQIQDDQVLVRIEYVGICGSDVHYWEHGKIGDFVVEGDFILGHECAGTVMEVGAAVSHLQVGDTVALEPGCTCGQCEFCKTGRYNLCPEVRFLATPPYHGCLTDYLAFPANNAFKLPAKLSTKEGALVEPLAVGMHAVKQGRIELGSSVIILGSGTIGLTTLLAAKAYGATEITVVDVVPKRLEFARKLGADHVILAGKEEVMGQAEKICPEGYDVVIETAGTAKTTLQTAYLVKRGGCVVLVGMAAQDTLEFNFAKLMAKEAQLQTVFRYRNIYPAAIRAIEKGLIDISGIVTHEFDFEQTREAFQYVIHNKEDVVKAVISMKA